MARSLTHSVTKVAGATLVFAIIHSLLASRAAKDFAARRFGERQRNAFYRVFFILQSLVTFAGLLWYVRDLPDLLLYRARGITARLMNFGQIMGLAHATYTAYHIGLSRILGVRSLVAWLDGLQAVPAEPEAQGPRQQADGRMKATGPFLWSRHPLNFSPLLVFWLNPVMTAKLAAFNIVATVYLVLGSIHEETRLRAAYGRAYQDYQANGVSFYFPFIRLLFSN